MTKFVGIIGYPLTHSISPRFQQAAFDHLGLDIRYEVWETKPHELTSRVEQARAPDTLGFNVTVPHKEAVISYLDELAELAARIKAVNTVVNDEGKLKGHNTDAEGFITGLRKEGEFDPKGKRAALLGAGGAARAVGFSLIEAGIAHLSILNRTLERAEALAVDLQHWGSCVKAEPWTERALRRTLADCDLIVNCTSVGMKDSQTEGQSPLEGNLIPRNALVYDLVYNPVETPLLAAAKKAGARAVAGLAMLVYQGAKAFELWTGREAPVDIMFKAARGAVCFAS